MKRLLQVAFDTEILVIYSIRCRTSVLSCLEVVTRAMSMNPLWDYWVQWICSRTTANKKKKDGKKKACHILDYTGGLPIYDCPSGLRHLQQNQFHPCDLLAGVWQNDFVGTTALSYKKQWISFPTVPIMKGVADWFHNNKTKRPRRTFLIVQTPQFATSLTCNRTSLF